jgi:uncharacterized small protein (DUF1192 family)
VIVEYIYEWLFLIRETIMFGEEDLPSSKISYSIGQTLDNLSVEEIDDLIGKLSAEIERLRMARDEKARHLGAADALFKKK